MAKRVTIGILESHHKQLVSLCKVTGHKISTLVDAAIETMLETDGPVWRRAAEELQKTKKKPAKR